MGTHQRALWERDKHNAHQQLNVEPEQGAIRPLDGVEGIVMRDPVDAHEHETEHRDQQFGPQVPVRRRRQPTREPER